MCLKLEITIEMERSEKFRFMLVPPAPNMIKGLPEEGKQGNLVPFPGSLIFDDPNTKS